jgi:hypothetical protein
LVTVKIKKGIVNIITYETTELRNNRTACGHQRSGEYLSILLILLSSISTCRLLMLSRISTERNILHVVKIGMRIIWGIPCTLGEMEAHGGGAKESGVQRPR